MKNKILILLIALLINTLTQAQNSVADKGLAMSLFQFQGGYYGAGGDFSELYGNPFEIGFSYAYKTPKNILFGTNFGFQFGNNVKDEGSLFVALRNGRDEIVGVEGEAITVLVTQRGYVGGLYIGKIFPIIGPNPNSGLVIKLGLNYFENRTWIEVREDEFAPLEGDYRKGYDRKRAGLALNQFVGYQHFDNDRKINFYAGFEFYQGFTTDYRSYNIDQMMPTNGDYLDLLYGIKVGWVFPVYRQVADKFYLD